MLNQVQNSKKLLVVKNTALVACISFLVAFVSSCADKPKEATESNNTASQSQAEKSETNSKNLQQDSSAISSLDDEINQAASQQGSRKGIQVSQEKWGEAEGKPVYLYTLTNDNDVTIKLINWGATIQSVLVPDKDGNIEDVTLGYDSFKEYYEDPAYHGPIVGRFGNRVGDAKFTIDGTEYQLTVNNNDNQLHGGKRGLHKRYWDGELLEQGVKFSYLSKDGEEGYPGNLSINVSYTLNNKNDLIIDYEATTDKPTHVNLTSHAYYNLSGDNKRSILDHTLMISADKITPVDDELIPDGSYADVKGTPFDFTQPKPIKQDINAKNEQLSFGKGYDHNWVFTEWDESLRKQAELFDPVSGRKLTILTTEPGIQFYSGNFMDGSTIGKNGKPVEFRHGLALEPQHFPDTPNQVNFPSTLLMPSETYKTTSVYRFTVEE